jgi:hypothetical protein
MERLSYQDLCIRVDELESENRDLRRSLQKALAGEALAVRNARAQRESVAQSLRLAART